VAVLLSTEDAEGITISVSTINQNIHACRDDYMHPTYLRIAAANHLSMLVPAAGMGLNMHREQAPSFAKRLGRCTTNVSP
jgi:hypothetical protein